MNACNNVIENHRFGSTFLGFYRPHYRFHPARTSEQAGQVEAEKVKKGDQ
jgi:hypothetical protein